MIVFPIDQEGKPTLAGEVKDLYEHGKLELILSRVTQAELLEVVARDFPEHCELVELFLKPFAGRFTRWPTAEEVQQALPFVNDPEDAPIFAAAVISRPDIVLSNDFETFHSTRAKAFWKRHGIQVESLYGLLCLFGRRKRKAANQA